MDSKLQEQGGYIFEKDGILFSCAMSICDQGKNLNEYVIMQLIILPENRLRLYYRRGRVGEDARAEERTNVDETLKEFARLFEELTGN
eukprot:TRINITY_DN16414_c0_g1_i1.p1 TRINITY_DN16414_c0_g1~~TRINITY_DN16414_c0_g1_i1.p1  ORF type:complete len:103 (-),score=14.91 TRINITY_DN16414_c0_g1_i1:111-374(-)